MVKKVIITLLFCLSIVVAQEKQYQTATLIDFNLIGNEMRTGK